MVCDIVAGLFTPEGYPQSTTGPETRDITATAWTAARRQTDYREITRLCRADLAVDDEQFSIPANFEDRACRAYKLLGVELNGLWLQSDEPTRRSLLEDHRDRRILRAAAFVLFAQIAGVMVATSATPPAALAGEASASTSRVWPR